LIVQFLYEVEFPCIAGIAIKGTTSGRISSPASRTKENQLRRSSL